jgi:hypothetical protein
MMVRIKLRAIWLVSAAIVTVLAIESWAMETSYIHRLQTCSTVGADLRTMLANLPSSDLADLAYDLLTQRCSGSVQTSNDTTDPWMEAPVLLLPPVPSASAIDVDNSTFNILLELGQLCSPEHGCTCFSGVSTLQRPVCGSAWASCSALGDLLSMYALSVIVPSFAWLNA